ncbi:MAG: hypothetical protein JNK85_04015 [Verrucomicrobiales bacterium]|nr:hypothetical protein [Verrucomicrobiales bacterium]
MRSVPGESRARFWHHGCALVLLLLGTLSNPGASADAATFVADGTHAFHAPIGPYTSLSESDFVGVPTYTATNRLVVTPYFYWYDVFSGEHLIDSDGTDALTDHPATFTGFSYRSSAWHRQQLLDMADAGIDVALPVYWGEPSSRIDGRPVSQQPWSYAGLTPLVEARDALVAQGRTVPRLGMFYDTSTLQFNAAGQRIDLTTPSGRQWFYESVRDYFSLIPPRHWAMMEGRPVVFLYAAGFATRHDPSCLETLAAGFAADFGGRRPYVVREISWNVEADQTYAWGGALGFKNPGVASLGPGYDHSAVPGRTPLVVPREDGAYFERQWLACLRRAPRMVMVETWNEFHEGTEIAHSREYGRQYIALNRRYADLYRQGFRPPALIGPFTGKRLVEVELAATNRSSGLLQLESADGVTQASIVADSPCRVMVGTEHASRYLYLRIDDSFKWAEVMEVVVLVEYFDGKRGTLRVEFDGSDPTAPFSGAYSPSDALALNGTGAWGTATFRLRGARFNNSQNGGADLRLSSGATEIAVRRVRVLREGLSAQRLDPESGFEMQLTAVPGRDYRIETSENLVDWQLGTTLRPLLPQSRYIDAAAATAVARWYRLAPPDR